MSGWCKIIFMSNPSLVVKMGWVEVAVGIVTNPFEPLMIGMAKFSPQIQNKFFYEKEAG